MALMGEVSVKISISPEDRKLIDILGWLKDQGLLNVARHTEVNLNIEVDGKEIAHRLLSHAEVREAICPKPTSPSGAIWEDLDYEEVTQ